MIRFVVRQVDLEQIKPLVDRLVETQPRRQQVGCADPAGVDRPRTIRDFILDVGCGHLGPIRTASIRLLLSPGKAPLACLKLSSYLGDRLNLLV